MTPIKKIDYRELAKGTPQAAQPGEVSQEEGALEESTAQQQAMPETEEKVSFFASLRNRWSLMDRKTKMELFVLVVVVIAIVGLIIFYFSSVKRPLYQLPPSYSRPAVD